MLYWLFGVPVLADFSLLVLRLVAGLMFAMSGYFKLTDPERRKKMVQSLSDAHVPTGLAVPLSSAELIGGVLVTLGLWTTLGTVALLIVSLGAVVTTTVPTAKGAGVHKLENVLYATEAILVAALLVLLSIGSGSWSLDGFLS